MGNGSDERSHPLLHLTGGLVGEGDGEDGKWRHPPFDHQVGDPSGQDAGLAGTGPGNHQQRARGVGDGIHLGGVQAVPQVLHRPACRLAGRRIRVSGGHRAHPTGGR